MLNAKILAKSAFPRLRQRPFGRKLIITSFLSILQLNLLDVNRQFSQYHHVGRRYFRNRFKKSVPTSRKNILQGS